MGANLKAEAMALMNKRTELEAQMNAIIDRLCQPGGPGISGNLVDSEVISLTNIYCYFDFEIYVCFLQFLGHQMDNWSVIPYGGNVLFCLYYNFHFHWLC